jgi:release factor glutamine methyltransferase
MAPVPSDRAPGAEPTWAELRAGAASRLGSSAEARWLVEALTGEQRPGGPVSEVARRRFDALVERRAAGEPLQYILGEWGFRTLELMVDRRVLIPRPETEQVVEAAVAELDRMGAGSPRERLVAVDLGTGSGAIALALAIERARVEVWATDVSEPALAVAEANLARLAEPAASRVQLAKGSWWTALPPVLRGRVDLLVSNPPYIASAEMPQLDAEVVAWEPGLALEAGPTGLEAIGEILGGALAWLRPGGVAVIEIAPHQSAPAATLARAAGFAVVEVRPDLAGRDRILVARAAA